MVEITVDPHLEAFLGDHRVDGSPLLPTVMGLDAMVAAVRDESPRAGSVELHDVRVGAPIRFPRAAPRAVRVATTRRGGALSDAGSTWDCRVDDVTEGAADDRRANLAARVVLGHRRDPAGRSECPPLRDGPLPLGAAEIYPPFFHGPLFRVVGDARATRAGIVARLAEPSPCPRWSRWVAATSPELLELCLQAAGLWELATSGRMMVPHRVGRIVAYDVPRPVGRVVAWVHARRSPVGSDETGPDTHFDATVVARDGTVLLRMQGYRTTDLGRPADSAAAARVRDLLGLVEVAPP